MAKKKPKPNKPPASTLAVSHLGQASLRGAEAYANGQRIGACPYPAWNPLADAWREGWNAEQNSAH